MCTPKAAIPEPDTAATAANAVANLGWHTGLVGWPHRLPYRSFELPAASYWQNAIRATAQAKLSAAQLLTLLRLLGGDVLILFASRTARLASTVLAELPGRFSCCPCVNGNDCQAGALQRRCASLWSSKGRHVLHTKCLNFILPQLSLA